MRTNAYTIPLTKALALTKAMLRVCHYFTAFLFIYFFSTHA
jgi:hypothetical protein